MSYGIPNPYVATTHPYPSPATGGKGGSWIRPVHTFPYMRSVQSVFLPSHFNDGNPALRGLGDVNAANGVFGTSQGGGGVFGPSLYGLGDTGEDIDAIAAFILNSRTTSPAAFDVQTHFRAWYNGLYFWQKDDDAKAKAENYRRQFIDANAVVSKATAPTSTAPAPSFMPMINDPNAPVATKGPTAPALTGQASGQSGDPRVSELQGYLNRVLKTAGLTALDQDGKLGAKGCGAIAWYRGPGRSLASASTAAAIDANLGAMGAIYASVCAVKGSTAPGGGGATTVKAPSVYVATPPVATPPVATPPVAPPPEEPAKASAMGAGTWAMIGGGLLAVGLAVVGKKKGWF